VKIEPTKYRKKPVVVEVMRWDGMAESTDKILNWANQTPGSMIYHPAKYTFTHTDQLRIRTYEGGVFAVPGDYIIWDYDEEEFSVCNSNIFAATYEKVH
jgi:hypothetical protein